MTPPQDASALPVSDRNPRLTDASAPGTLIVAAEEIFDAATVRARISDALAQANDAAAMRAAAVTVLAAANARGRAAIEAGFDAAPLAARRTTRAYAYLTDCLVREVLHVAQTALHPNPMPSDTERMAVMAVGGYGRGEMAPYSDVDLLFVMPWKMTAAIEKVIESSLYMLWDLRMKVGHASRTVKECLRLGKQDVTIRTSLLEMRYLTGDRAVAGELQTALREQLFEGTVGEFIEAKLEERSARHKKQGGQRYMLEPNVKEGKGGLRDLQTLYWIAKYEHGVARVAELVERGNFRPEEFAAFDAAERFLWAVRCHLHLIAGRAQDQLTFDNQVQVAERMGYHAHSGRRAVEHFMQDYFRHATQVGELTRIFLTELEARHVKQEPAILGFLRGRRQRRKKVRDGYAIKQNRLTVEAPDAFFADKVNILRLFEEALRTGYLIHPDAMREVQARIDTINDAVRRDPEAVRIFLDLLLKHGNPERALRRMNELGVLAAFLPEFSPVVAMMQFNMYHSYTVDEHTIQVISTLAQIEREELLEELPVASGILKRGVNRKVLYVACLLHDIGKGRKEDHSIVGARIARNVCPRLGLKPAECETVEWLVRYHLLMSDMAQKRDISDPRTVRDFAKAVKTRERLELLTVLTVCDIRGVGPNVWNNWKATLLRGLYRATETALETGLEDLNREKLEGESKRALREALAEWPKAELKTEIDRHYGPYWQGLDLPTQITFAGMLRGIGADEIRIDTRQDEDRDATRVCFALSDHPGIFSRLAGALSLVGANVVDARTYTSKDGFATAVFWVQDAEGNPYEAARLPRLKGMIDKTLKGEVVASRALEGRDKIKKRERPFDVPTTITFDNEGSEIYTIIEVDTRDRPGLLYDLTKTLAGSNIYISHAVIATYGAQVVDVFYVKDLFGLKLYTRARQETLERKLRDAIARVAERAGA
ncbi:[protein-PII] uridylyltransferase [Roseibacterium sp. SDUM158017]|uniref:[protein-PII] uridylyltransferase n=1 Tax=Roseicyclus salinarum TaxID=3036773 RepID=UPI0024150A9E|nr:[protein-PII] uridylyltransferase [Roseibacterium sp. SDUM158017]MDG4647219.1 [protein-PII] uridylyltransferase [Roseibacterium sp. SDUM158017]